MFGYEILYFFKIIKRKHNIIGLFLKGQNLPALVVVLATAVVVVVGVLSAVLDKELEILDHLIKSRI